jgi:glycosyltransferase involved in cell wall biosynthesis
MISVLVLTRNEVRDLPGCLASVAWSDDIHVLDSFSTDGTQALARAAGAYVTERIFDNWSAHQNWALANLPFRHPWVFYLDADERVTPELRDAMLGAVRSCSDSSAQNAPVAFRLQRRDFLYGTWLRHVQTTAFYMRLFRPDRMRYERLVNPVSIPSGPVGQLPGYLDHFPFSKGIAHWVERHNSYSTFEAEQTVANRAANTPFSLRTALLGRDFSQRRFHQKELFYRLPSRPLLKFLYLYILRRGFLDGSAGLTYACLQSVYEYLIVLKTRERERGTSSPEM